MYLVRGDSVHVTNISNWGRSTITHQPHHKWFQWKGDRQDWTKEQMCWKSMLAGFMEWLMKSLRFWFKWSAHIRRKAPPANLPFYLFFTNWWQSTFLQVRRETQQSVSTSIKHKSAVLFWISVGDFCTAPSDLESLCNTIWKDSEWPQNAHNGAISVWEWRAWISSLLKQFRLTLTETGSSRMLECITRTLA